MRSQTKATRTKVTFYRYPNAVRVRALGVLQNLYWRIPSYQFPQASEIRFEGRSAMIFTDSYLYIFTSTTEEKNKFPPYIYLVLHSVPGLAEFRAFGSVSQTFGSECTLIFRIVLSKRYCVLKSFYGPIGAGPRAWLIGIIKPGTDCAYRERPLCGLANYTGALGLGYAMIREDFCKCFSIVH